MCIALFDNYLKQNMGKIHIFYFWVKKAIFWIPPTYFLADRPVCRVYLPLSAQKRSDVFQLKE